MKYYRFNMSLPVENYFTELRYFLFTHQNYKTCLNFENSKGLTVSDIELIQRNFPNVLIRIAGGYTDKKISTDKRDYLKYDNIYTFDETIKILTELERIESGINKNWTKEQLLFYFIGYLKNKIIYHPNFEEQPSKEIRSLTGLFSHKTVCAGYSLILKELCDRNGIDCDYVTGFTSKDEKTGKCTGAHAWNLVHFGDITIPIDLTWNASRSNSGRFMDISDIANVNEFIKNHIPDDDEPIQDYSDLKSLDGEYVRTIYEMVNTTMVYDTTKFNFRRKDGISFSVSLVGQEVYNNECVYTYAYTLDMGNNNSPISCIVRCGTNIPGIYATIEKLRRATKELEKARKENNSKRIKELEKFINGLGFFNEFYDMIANVLFSSKNILEAAYRGDMYLGKIVVNKDKDDNITGLKGVEIDPKFAREFNKEFKIEQKIYTRSDGTKFVLESLPPLMRNKNVYAYRYRMYENIVNEEGKAVVKKNTIITDENLFEDARQDMVDNLLSRERVDRKEKESSGYLGYFSLDGVKTYYTVKEKVFNEEVYKSHSLSEDNIRNYYPDITFEDMKRLVKSFKTVDGYRVVNLKTGKVVTDQTLITQFLFANLWLHSANSKYTLDDEIPGFSYAFSDSSKMVFEFISSKITESINTYGYIDPVDILVSVNKDSSIHYKYAEDIVINFFATPYHCEIINNLYRLQNPGALNTEKEVPYFGIGHYGKGKALSLIADRTADNEDREKQKIDVTYENGDVVMRGR